MTDEWKDSSGRHGMVRLDRTITITTVVFEIALNAL